MSAFYSHDMSTAQQESLLEAMMGDMPGDIVESIREQGQAEPLPLDTVEEQNMDTADIKPQLPRETIFLSTRPPLRRDGSVPAPHLPPPPTPPVGSSSSMGPEGEGNNPTDSLSLMQLRRIVTELPRVEPTPYAFTYADAASLPEELEEWFTYGVEERARILKAQSSFAQEWASYNGWVFLEGSAYADGALDWINAGLEDRRGFVERCLRGLKERDLDKRLRSLEALVYLCLGCWYETAGLQNTATIDGKRKSTEPESPKEGHSSQGTDTNRSDPRGKALAEHFAKSKVQLEWIKRNVDMLFDCGGLPLVHELFRDATTRDCALEPEPGVTAVQKEAKQRETWCSLAILYISLEVVRTKEDASRRLAMRAEFLRLEPNLLVYLCSLINNIRWDDTIQLPLIKILLLIWKAILVIIGGLPDVEAAKASFDDDQLGSHDSSYPIITASPLDYHSFRQEISSKYPAYNPPPPLFPLEPESKSILPPLRVNPTKPTPSTTAEVPHHGVSILHQPVHIATPAPSPPPSPAAGKGGKKQNYQTNQLFPFLYPPLDASSTFLGGKGSTGLQDALAGRKWTGSDIPASILEAAELFSKRMRATRAMKQLWAERVDFMKFERGWAPEDEDDKSESSDSSIEIPKLDLDLVGGESVAGSLLGELQEEDVGPQQEEKTPRVLDGSVEERLQAVEDFYRDGLPHLQSLVMVLLKTILANVTALITQTNGQTGVQGSFQFQDGQNGASGKAETNGLTNGFTLDAAHVSTEELDAVRVQEITAKAASGTLVLLLKWFKVSHILKFEYLTQLLVDANYIPMILKLLQTQEVERIVNYRSDREDFNFFHHCRAHSRVGLETEQEEEHQDLSDSDNEAAPPPVIKRHREEPPPQEQHRLQQTVACPPEVDELGVPTSELPSEPITTFSWRNFFSSINFLRILQKICKGKAHRNLMLVTYKSANYLKKSLKVPQPELRLYTLKLFKNQVPYCGRKWRQSNMRVITAVYLHCRPELRDEWLSGADVDGEVEQSVPMEQALRALTHWYNLKRYPTQMGATKGILKEEQDFFVRELDKMEWLDVGTEEVGEEGHWEGQQQAIEGWWSSA